MMRKGLQSIDIIGGVVIFLTMVLYVAFSVINLAETYDTNMRENTLYQEAWISLQKITQDLADNEGNVNEAKLAYYVECVPGTIERYKEIRDMLGIDIENTFRLLMQAYAVGLAERIENRNYVGRLILEDEYEITFIEEDNEYSKVDILGTVYDDNPTTSTPSEITLDNTIYTIDLINRGGQYILLSNKTVTCGVSYPDGRKVVGINRYLVKDNQIFKVRMEYW